MKLHIPQHLTSYSADTLSGERDLSNVLIEDADFAGTSLNGLSIEAARLVRVSLETSKLKHFNLTDVYIEDCLLFGTDMDGAGWRRVEIKHGTLSGLVISDANIEEASFLNCKLNLANFRFSKLKKATFKNCNLREADFYAAALTDVAFEKCDLSGANFGGATLSKVNLQTSNLADIKGVLGLKGARIDTGQLIALAPILAAEIGIEIEA